MGKLQRRENLMAAFAHFDNDDSGYITEEELLTVGLFVRGREEETLLGSAVWT